MPPQTLLLVEQIVKKYSNQEEFALDKVDFSLQEGEVAALLGQSGSGKSSLLRIIAGLDHANEGTVYFKGEAIKGPQDKLVPGHPEIKMVFQQFNLLPNHTVEENIEYELRFFDADYKKQRTEYLLSLCKLDKYKQRLPKSLSGGEQQRLAIAKALADEPSILLFDEPFSNMDPLLKEEMKPEIRRILQESGSAALIVTHSHEEAFSLADRIMMMYAGKIVQDGSSRMLYEQPLNAYIAKMLGVCNVFPKAYILPFEKGRGEILIRPSEIKLNEEGQISKKVIVDEVRYMGTYQAVYAHDGPQSWVLHVSPNLLLLKEQEIWISFDL